MVKPHGFGPLFGVLFGCFVICGITSCQTRVGLERCRSRVRSFCENAQPVRMLETSNVSFPDMDDATLLASAKLARRGDAQFYGDLGALIVRVSRTQDLTSSTSIPFETTQDVPRYFTAQYAHIWKDFGDDPLLSQISDWIKSKNGKLISSELLTSELNSVSGSVEDARKAE